MRTFFASTLIVTLMFCHHGWARTISWSGHEWVVKSSQEPFGPGPNLWSNSQESVRVDDAGRLHLKIRKIGDRWHAAEIYALKSLGYGKYIFYLDSRVDNLDSNVVAGLFIHSDDTHEVDIEFSKWGQSKKYTYHQFVIQPRVDDGNIHRSEYRVRSPMTAHGFRWAPDSINFRSFVGHETQNKAPQKSWDYIGRHNPAAKSERVHINLWLYKGQPPTDENEAVLVVDKFDFIPLDQLQKTTDRPTQNDAQAAKRNNNAF